MLAEALGEPHPGHSSSTPPLGPHPSSLAVPVGLCSQPHRVVAQKLSHDHGGAGHTQKSGTAQPAPGRTRRTDGVHVDGRTPGWHLSRRLPALPPPLLPPPLLPRQTRSASEVRRAAGRSPGQSAFHPCTVWSAGSLPWALPVHTRPGLSQVMGKQELRSGSEPFPRWVGL